MQVIRCAFSGCGILGRCAGWGFLLFWGSFGFLLGYAVRGDGGRIMVRGSGLVVPSEVGVGGGSFAEGLQIIAGGAYVC